MNVGKPQEITGEILNLFKPVEGQTAFYYGRIRNGKTYSATADILELLERGEVVFANWKLNLEDYDERERFGVAFGKFIFGKKLFFKYKVKENFHYFSPDLPPHEQMALLGKLVGVHIFIDEGQWIFNSHIKNHDDETRKLILHNGHYCRSLNIISQRPSNVMKDMRSQINVWYKCEKKFAIGGLILFTRTAIEDMVEDMPDEENMGRPKIYWAKKRVLRAYNTHAMRGVDALETPAQFEVYKLNSLQRFGLVLLLLVPRFVRSGVARLKPRPRAERRAQKIMDRAFEETYPNTIPLKITDVKIIR